MKNMVKSFFFIGLFLVSFNSVSQVKEYSGTAYFKGGDSMVGLISVNLKGSNPILIKIAQKTGRNSSGVKINSNLIDKLLINETLYYFMDLKEDDDKLLENRLMTRVSGTANFGLYIPAVSPNKDTAYYAKLPNENNFTLVNVSSKIYSVRGTWQLYSFSKCKSLYSKIKANEPMYTLTAEMTLSQRLEVWKIWIEEFSACI